MFHQCLQCGKVYPSGSGEILNGCSECGGKKFFLISEPVPEVQRLEIAEKADRDVHSLIQELFSRREDSITTDDRGIPSPDKGEWVKLSPDPDDSSEGSEGLEQKKKVKKHRKLFKRRTQRDDVPDEPLVGRPRNIQRFRVKATLLKGKKSLGKLFKKRKTPENVPEVITVVEPGVYEIDLERLLDNCPIIIQNDGTYLIHLPSAFNRSEE